MLVQPGLDGPFDHLALGVRGALAALLALPCLFLLPPALILLFFLLLQLLLDLFVFLVGLVGAIGAANAEGWGLEIAGPLDPVVGDLPPGDAGQEHVEFEFAIGIAIPSQGERRPRFRQVVGKLDETDDPLDQLQIVARELVHHREQRDGAAAAHLAEIRDHRQGRGHRVDHRLERLGHILNLAHRGLQEHIDKGARVQVEATELELLDGFAVAVGIAPIPAQVEGAQHRRKGRRIAAAKAGRAPEAQIDVGIRVQARAGHHVVRQVGNRYHGRAILRGRHQVDGGQHVQVGAIVVGQPVVRVHTVAHGHRQQAHLARHAALVRKDVQLGNLGNGIIYAGITAAALYHHPGPHLYDRNVGAPEVDVGAQGAAQANGGREDPAIARLYQIVAEQRHTGQADVERQIDRITGTAIAGTSLFGGQIVADDKAQPHIADVEHGIARATRSAGLALQGHLDAAEEEVRVRDDAREIVLDRGFDVGRRGVWRQGIQRGAEAAERRYQVVSQHRRHVCAGIQRRADQGQRQVRLVAIQGYDQRAPERLQAHGQVIKVDGRILHLIAQRLGDRQVADLRAADVGDAEAELAQVLAGVEIAEGYPGARVARQPVAAIPRRSRPVQRGPEATYKVVDAKGVDGAARRDPILGQLEPGPEFDPAHRACAVPIAVLPAVIGAAGQRILAAEGISVQHRFDRTTGAIISVG